MKKISRSPSPSWSNSATPPVVLSTISFFSALPLTMGIVSPDSGGDVDEAGGPLPRGWETETELIRGYPGLA